MRIAVLIALVVAAFYLVKFLIRGVQFLVKITRKATSRITGHPIETEEPEKKTEKQDELMDALFPGGEEEIDKEVRKLRSRLLGYYAGSMVRSLFVDASKYFALSEDRSESKTINYILEKSNDEFSEHDAKVLHDFIYTRELRLTLDLDDEELNSLNDIDSLTGCDADEVPSGKGAFGLSADNPIPVKGIIANEYYLSRLRTWKGERIMWERVGSSNGTTDNKLVDVYRIFDMEGEEMAKFYISPYHKRVSNRAPKGFRLLTKADMDSPSFPPDMGKGAKGAKTPPPKEEREPASFTYTTSTADGKKKIVVGDMRLLAAGTALLAVPAALLAGGQEEAAEQLKEAVRNLDSFPGPDDEQTVTWLVGAADYSKLLGDTETAERLLERAMVAETSGLGTQDPDQQTKIRLQLGELLVQNIRFGRAETLLRTSLQDFQQRYGKDHENTLKAMVLLGIVLQNGPTLEEAEHLLQLAVRLIPRTLGEESDLYATAMDNLARALLKLNKTGEALGFAEKANGLRLRLNGPEDLKTAVCMGTLALVYKREGKYAQAEKLQRQLLTVLQKATDRQHQLIYGIELGNLAGTLVQKGNTAGAIPLYYQALEAKEAATGTENPGLIHTLTNLTCLHAERKEFTAAISLAKRAYDIQLATYGDMHPETQKIFTLFQKVREDKRMYNGSSASGSAAAL